MNYSGLLISLDPKAVEPAMQALDGLHELDLYHFDKQTARLIAVVEASDTSAEAAVFKRIRTLPGVVDVSLINHYFGDEAQQDAVA